MSSLGGRFLVATAGSIRLFDDKGEPQADIVYTSRRVFEAKGVQFLFRDGVGVGISAERPPA
ncbi:hypothetical protein [Bradyrhizobium sp. USDA 3315]